MKRNLICIICPRGCDMTAQIQVESITITGNACPKGEEYAINECLHPMRTVTATVRVANREDTMVSVKTEHPIPKGNMMDVMEKLRAITVNAPVSIGDEILPDIFGTRIVVTKKID